MEIKMGREIAYREGYADKDPIDKLSLNKLKLLQAAIDASQQADMPPTRETKGTINIKAGDELVYRLSKGAVEVNQLHPDSTAQHEDAALEIDQDQVETATQAVELSSPPTEAGIFETQAPESSERPENKGRETSSFSTESATPKSTAPPDPAVHPQKPLAAQPLKL
ncbi:MAG: hypothetical protein AAF722_20875, partial [Cyanobacteria bacterium P01_C01_bin.70]